MSDQQVTKKQVTKLKELISSYFKEVEKTEKISVVLKTLRDNQKVFDDIIIATMQKHKHDSITFDTFCVKNTMIERTKPASKKFLEQRTLELCNGDETKKSSLFDALFSITDLEITKTKKLKVEDADVD